MKIVAASLSTASALALAGLLAAGAHAAICDKTFYMQTGVLTTLTGATTTTLTPASRLTVGKDMGGLEVIHPETGYEIVTRFEGNGACAEWKKTSMDFASRKRAASNEFKAVATTSNYTKLHSTPYPFTPGIDFLYWFGFASQLRGDTAVIFEAIGQLKSASHPHVYYAAAIMTRTIKDAVLGTPKGTRTHYFEGTSSSPDSASLLNGLLSAWKNEKNNDTQTVSFKAQMLRITYDTVPPTTGVRGAVSRSKGAGFQATQSGNLVMIRPAEGKVAASEALGLYNMIGHRVATLHPTGYFYNWNGRTAGGAEAPTGVYFVQSGSRILGKFFYHR